MNCYDYPQYWDLAFRDETKYEVAFLKEVITKYGKGSFNRVMEPGCGGGRMVVQLAAQGYQVLAYDVHPPAIRYVQRRLRRRGLQADVFVADMRSYTARPQVDCAMNTVSTFRHLLTEQDAVSHLEAMVASIRRGGLYVLGMHLLPPDADLEDEESWVARHGSTTVGMHLKVMQTSRRRRLETLRFEMDVVSGNVRRTFQSDYVMRIYTAKQIRDLLCKVPEFELLEVYDYGYDIREPQMLDNRLGDAVFILRRR